MSKGKSADPKTTIKGIIILLAIIVIGWSACASKIKRNSDSANSASPETASDNYLRFDLDTNRPEYDAVARSIITHYVNCNLPDYLDYSEWVYADFDDQDDGKVMVSTSAAIDGVMAKQPVWLIFSTDGTRMQGYYLCVGDTLFIDDGSCSETMAKLGLPTKEQQ